MPLELGKYVVAGEIINRRRNLTHGWLALRDAEQPMILQFTGDPSADLMGKRLRFSIPDDRPLPDPAPPPLDYKRLSWQQIGPTGEMSLQGGDRSGTPPVLRLEWFSQNGHVVLELVDPELEWVENDDEDEEDEAAVDPAAETAPDDKLGERFEVGLGLPDDDEDDPYGLFPPGLDDELSEGDEDPLGDTDQSPQPRSWDEVVPGIDEETKRMYEDWDEVTHGSHDVPLREIFDPPIKLYTPEQLAELDDATVEAALKELLKRLALLGVALCVCEHYTPKRAYQYLAEEILPEYGVHPRLPQIGWVQHYDTSEACPQCQAEFEIRWGSEPEEQAVDEDQAGDETVD